MIRTRFGKIINIDDAYNTFEKRKSRGFYYLSEKDIGTSFVLFCERLKMQGFIIE